jgi:recombination protein RecR
MRSHQIQFITHISLAAHAVAARLHQHESWLAHSIAKRAQHQILVVNVTRLVDVLRTVKERVKFCTECGNISEEELCRICRDPRRDPTLICVVEESKDVMSIEKTREFRGKYHVLGGAISPIDGVGPEQLRIRELMVRLVKRLCWHIG